MVMVLSSARMTAPGQTDAVGAEDHAADQHRVGMDEGVGMDRWLPPLLKCVDRHGPPRFERSSGLAKQATSLGTSGWVA